MDSLNFPTTGDAQRDAREAAAIRRAAALEAEGLCPNDDGGVLQLVDPYTKRCSVCVFEHHANVPWAERDGTPC